MLPLVSFCAVRPKLKLVWVLVLYGASDAGLLGLNAVFSELYIDRSSVLRLVDSEMS